METKEVTLALVTTILLAMAIVPAVAASDGSNWTVRLLSPKPYQVVTDSYLQIWMQSSGYRMDARYAGTPDLPTVGHVHEILDGRLIDMVPVSPDGMSSRDAISMVGVTPGLHYLTIVPARNDHSMITASAVTTPFYYEGPYLPEPRPYNFTSQPSITIVSPTPLSTVSGAYFLMTVNIQNFVVCGNCYGKDLVNGVGHWHIFADQPMMPNMQTMANTNTQQNYLLGLPNGWHTFYAVLVNNQHMPFMVTNPDGTMGFAPGTITSITLYVNNS
jgi:hypothetical protein